MDVVNQLLLPNLLAYLVSLAANERSSAVTAARERRLREIIEKEDVKERAFSSSRSLKEEVTKACVELAREKAVIGIPQREIALWNLLAEETFQADVSEWLIAGGMAEGAACKERLLGAMNRALAATGTSQSRISVLTTEYFDALDKVMFENGTLARWRHQLSLEYLREQVVALRQQAEEIAGVYSPEKQATALAAYSDKALAACDIIDLSNLPEGDVHLATQQLLLRQLYIPLRVEAEPPLEGEDDDAVLGRLEGQRRARRLREAGHRADDRVGKIGTVRKQSSVVERLAETNRLVVLGEPGGGKTTMLRWLATAFLLRLRNDGTLERLPDATVLPSRTLIPVLIRCRDLHESHLGSCFTDFLSQHLHKTELRPQEAEIMTAILLDRIAKGEVLLLIDGLDEITNTNVRIMFCQELERTAARYPETPIVVTSRIVGYRDMPYRMGSGFVHSQICELRRTEKDTFARRWIEVTEQYQPQHERESRVRELVGALHSSDRIERLTGNPLMLTTLALIKRKVGKLPNRRSKLYAEAVSVLLNWNPRLYQAIEEDEAIPQLEYLAYEMCRRGVQQLTEDDVLDLLDRLREEYPHLRALKRCDPREFLTLLEARSGILIRSGGSWRQDRSRETPVWEFRHLTFQEYLAARALVEGRYPGRARGRSVAEQVASLAGSITQVPGTREDGNTDREVSEPWREGLRLLVAGCKDDDVDDVLLAILNPLSNEEVSVTTRPRAVLAALCLADEPNVSEVVGRRVLERFASVVDLSDGTGTSKSKSTLDRAASEIANSSWAAELKSSLIEEYCRRPPATRRAPGGVWGRCTSATTTYSSLLSNVGEQLRSGDRVERISVALAVMDAAFLRQIGNNERLADVRTSLNVSECVAGLWGALTSGGAEAHAAAWALLWLSGGYSDSLEPPLWHPSECEIDDLVSILAAAPADERDFRKYVVWILAKVPSPKSFRALALQLAAADSDLLPAAVEVLGLTDNSAAFSLLASALSNKSVEVRRAAVRALGTLRDRRAVPLLVEKIDDPDMETRKLVISILGRLGTGRNVPLLLERLDQTDDELRWVVIGALGELGDARVMSRLLPYLDSADARTRRATIQALEELGDSRAVPALLRRLEAADDETRRAIVGALGDLPDKRVVPVLLARLEDGDLIARWRTIRSLGELRAPEAVVPLLEILDDPEALLRWAAAMALGSVGDRRAVAPLLAKLDEAPEGQTGAIATALGLLADTRAVPALLNRLQGTDVKTSVDVIEALGHLGDKAAVPSLLAILEHEDPEIRRVISNALGEIGDSSAAFGLVQRLSDRDRGTRLAAIAALGQVQDPKALMPMLEMLDDPDDQIRTTAIRTLGVLGDARSVEPLLRKLDDDVRTVRRAAVRAVAGIELAVAVPHLVRRLEDEDAETRRIVCEVLGTSRGSVSLKALLERLEDPDVQVRFAAIGALGEMDDPAAVDPLLALLANEDPEIRSAVCEALGTLGEPAVHTHLVEMLVDEYPEVRAAALEALGRLKNPRLAAQLPALVEDQDDEVARAALRAMVRLGQTGAVGPLVARFDGDDIEPSVARAGCYMELAALLQQQEGENSKTAIAVLEAGRRRLPDNLGLGNNLAYAYLMQGDIASARQVIDTFDTQKSHRDVHFNATVGLVHLVEGDVTKASQSYETAAVLAMRQGDANLARAARQKLHLELARHYARVGDTTKARAELVHGLGIESFLFEGDLRALQETLDRR